ncbi:hypothetical protein HNQ51_000679 [Inhella inkyongensis]|uniref:DUF2946 domain-containing protein n=1 Tax=Inhella inkyongensis TaxID=392593 RepID=A0A840S2S4_9BURK|nr:hypothetical protein [Inhella inkyongensis]MBB5203386.1 hypothetical protein [Inhella inkyongensis]
MSHPTLPLTFHRLRPLRRWASGVLLLWLLTLGAAVASPWLRASDDLCRSPDAALVPSDHSLQCAACLPAVAPPPVELQPPPLPALPHAPALRRPCAEIPASYLGTALARGPPASF